jgi:predicted phosphodiesterase
MKTKSQELYQLLLKSRQRWLLKDLSEKLDCTIDELFTCVSMLEKQGKSFNITGSHIELSKEIIKSSATTISKIHFEGDVFKFGVTSDNHLGSKYERLDVLNAAYDTFEKQGITAVYNAGNMIDGEARFNKHDIHKIGVENQVNYLVSVFPKRKGITTYFVTGDDHEGWYTQREGIDVGRFVEQRAIAKGRNDLKYLGHMEHDLLIPKISGTLKIRIVHPGGGSAYAVSYTTQKLVESYSPGEKPHILIIGHYHKAEYLFYRGIHCLQAGTTMDQSPFMRKKRLAAHVGFWCVECKIGKNAVVQSFKTEFFPFYDRDYYDKAWKYQW